MAAAWGAGGHAVGLEDLRFKYRLTGKREKVTIGAYPAFTIKQARDRHEELRAPVKRGQSLAKAKRAPSKAQKVAEARRLSFRAFATRWVDETLFYRSGGYVAQTVRRLDVYVYPAIIKARAGRTPPPPERERAEAVKPGVA